MKPPDNTGGYLTNQQALDAKQLVRASMKPPDNTGGYPGIASAS